MQTKFKALAASALLLGALPAYATNGMNMEGYGPVAQAMGGAALAYDNGTAALMNNPATLALMADGTRLDLAAGFLGPKVSVNGKSSSADAFAMPAFGVAHKRGDLVTGFGVFSQGGMGAEFGNAGLFSSLSSMMGSTVADPGLHNRSEVGVGRALIPLAWKANDRLTLGGSLDYVWATMDLQMLIDGRRFGDMITGMGGSGRFGTANGSLLNALGSMGDVNWGYFNFSDNNRFSGAAKAHGWAGKLGATYVLTPQLTAGVVYQTKTDLSDMHTGGATLLLNGGGMTMPVKGSVTVKNFQWPEMYGIGVSYTPDDRWQVVADYRHIGWAAVMKRFQMTFDGGVMGSLNLSLNQDWKDQNVLMLGTAYRYTPQLTLRAGLNVANNPIASSTVNPLFPAIVKSHVSAGLGYQINKGSSVDASVVYAPKVKMQSDFSGTQISHGQTNAQILYSMFF